MNKQIVHFTIQ